MIQVPVFGMEHNPESLSARCAAMAAFYGYRADQWGDHVEVIGYVPSPPVTSARFELESLINGGAPKVEMIFCSAVVPYARYRARLPHGEALSYLDNEEWGGLWYLESVKAL